MIWLVDIIVSDWVGSIDQMPGRPSSVDSDPERSLNMDADLPQMCRDKYLLLASSNSRVKCLMDVKWVGMVRGFRPELTP